MDDHVIVQVVQLGDAPMPAMNDSGVMLLVASKEDTINYGSTLMVPTGISIRLPDGYIYQLRPDYELASNHGVIALDVSKVVGTELNVFLLNISDEDVYITKGMNIAQLIVTKLERIMWNPVCSLSINDAKNRLQEHAQRKDLPMPDYNTNYTGATNDRVFKSTVRVCLSQHECKSFVGNLQRTKRDAEKSAALMALNHLKLFD